MRPAVTCVRPHRPIPKNCRRTLVRTRPHPPTVKAGLDFHAFREVTAPFLKAGYLGATAYFAMQWKMYRDVRAAAEDSDTSSDGEDEEQS